jgi:nitroimidazol reductase NimA-like FMN-containing flavoprotein (pyridoxamine 5'-phosphate oxidase superfamily)
MSAIAALFPLPASPQNLPLFRTLGAPQSEALLARNASGRIAFTLDGRVQMLPVNYVYVNGWIYGRTASAAYLPRNAPVAFEVEERNSPSEWRSVVIQGQLEMVECKTPAKTSRGWRRVLSTLRKSFAPRRDEAPTVLFRDQVFCIPEASMSGRASLPNRILSHAS